MAICHKDIVYKLSSQIFRASGWRTSERQGKHSETLKKERHAAPSPSVVEVGEGRAVRDKITNSQTSYIHSLAQFGHPFYFFFIVQTSLSVKMGLFSFAFNLSLVEWRINAFYH